jgi:hypothetical protein
MLSVFPECSFLGQLNSVEPPWYGPVCPVVWEGWRRETSPYPDPWHILDVPIAARDYRSTVFSGLSRPLELVRILEASACRPRSAALEWRPLTDLNWHLYVYHGTALYCAVVIRANSRTAEPRQQAEKERSF